MRVAICRVGLVSPRSTWESIGALTPDRSARSRSERSIASRRARTLSPRPLACACAGALVDIRMYAITYGDSGGRVGSLGRMMRSRPDVLVLGGGGVLGEAWMMGVLAGIEDAAGIDMRDCESFVGTSAGSIVAAHLVSGNAPRRPSSVGTELEVGDRGPARGLAVAAVTAAR